ncbi:MAG: hypothetical protein H6836_03305 [Planctomycetes bacterium]|nr:hypothetical protein [Planctomycetota bacterium]
MRDDEEDDECTDEDALLGRLLRFESMKEPGRADYALPPGTPALEGYPPEFEPAPDRRRFLAVGLSAAALGFGSAWAIGLLRNDPDATPLAPPAPPPDETLSGEDLLQLQGARALAAGSLARFLKYHRSFLITMERIAPRDPALWDGVRRLARAAVLDPRADGPELARRLLPMLTSEPTHPEHGRLIAELRELLERHRTRPR